MRESFRCRRVERGSVWPWTGMKEERIFPRVRKREESEEREKVSVCSHVWLRLVRPAVDGKHLRTSIESRASNLVGIDSSEENRQEIIMINVYPEETSIYILLPFWFSHAVPFPAKEEGLPKPVLPAGRDPRTGVLARLDLKVRLS